MHKRWQVLLFGVSGLAAMSAAALAGAPMRLRDAEQLSQAAGLFGLLLASPMILLLLMAAQVALVMLVTAANPQRIQTEAALLIDQRRQCFGWGLLTGLLMLLLNLLFARVPVLAQVIQILSGFALATGFAGVGYAVGQRLFLAGRSPNPALAAAAGAGVLCLSSLVPLLGQVLAFYILFLSLGAFRLTWFGKTASVDKVDSM